MKKCNCKDWEENMKIMSSAIMLYHGHGFGGIKKSFNYCPYCGKELIEVKENER